MAVGTFVNLDCEQSEDSGFQGLDCESFVSGTWILLSLSCILDSPPLPHPPPPPHTKKILPAWLKAYFLLLRKAPAQHFRPALYWSRIVAKRASNCL